MKFKGWWLGEISYRSLQAWGLRFHWSEGFGVLDLCEELYGHDSKPGLAVTGREIAVWDEETVCVWMDNTVHHTSSHAIIIQTQTIYNTNSIAYLHIVHVHHSIAGIHVVFQVSLHKLKNKCERVVSVNNIM